jgi:DNA-binding transcriptional ArsR family regulator
MLKLIDGESHYCNIMNMKQPEIDYEKESELLKALGHPVRLKISAGILFNECNVNKIVEHLGLPQSTVSQHLGVLRKAGVIYPEKDGVTTCYKIADERIAKIIKLLLV